LGTELQRTKILRKKEEEAKGMGRADGKNSTEECGLHKITRKKGSQNQTKVRGEKGGDVKDSLYSWG